LTVATVALGVEITAEAARVLASGSRGTPRELHGLLRRARDLAQIESGSVDGAVLSGVIAERALSSKGIDPSRGFLGSTASSSRSSSPETVLWAFAALRT